MAQPEWPVDRFREMLDRILKQTGLTQGDLAALVPMDQSQLSRWKSGSSRPKYDNLSAFADAVEASHPSIGVSKQEILASAGYGASIVVHVGTAAETDTAGVAIATQAPRRRDGVPIPPIPPGHEIPPEVDLTSIPAAEMGIWLLPLPVRQRRVLVASLRALQEAEREAADSARESNGAD